jgi:cohesin loading factor subunit SCC2
MSLRTASLDYLGIVAARLRKDAVTSKLNEDVVNDIINHIYEDDEHRNKSKKEDGVKIMACFFILLLIIFGF